MNIEGISFENDSILLLIVICLFILTSFASGEMVADLFYRVGYFLEEMGQLDGAAGVYTQARYYYEISR